MVQRVVNYYILFVVCVLPFIIAPWAKDYYYQPKIAILYCISLALLFYLIINWRKIELQLISYDYVLLSFLLLVLISTLLSVDPARSLWGRLYRRTGLLAILSYGFIFFVSSKLFNLKTKYLNVLLLSSCVVCAYAIMQYFGYDPIPPDHIRRHFIAWAHATIGNPNFLGSYLTLILPISVFAYLCTIKKSYLLTSSILYLTLLCTKSRGAWLGSLFALILLTVLIHTHMPKLKRLMVVIAAFVGITLILNWYNYNETIDRFGSIITNAKSVASKSQLDGSGGVRIFIWKKSVQLIQKSPFAGSGPDTFDLAFMRAYRDEARTRVGSKIIDKAHNEYLQLAVTTGVPAALLYVIFLVLILKEAIKNTKKSIFVIPLLCGISGYAIQAFFNISVVSVAPLYWALLGILCKSAHDPVSLPHN